MEIISEFVDFVLQIVFWYLVFEIVAKTLAYFIKQWAQTKLDEINIVKKKLDDMIHYVKQEKHGDMYYWFNETTDAFIAQGTTDDAIKEHLKVRYKTPQVFVIADRAIITPEMKIVALSDLSKSITV